MTNFKHAMRVLHAQVQQLKVTERLLGDGPEVSVPLMHVHDKLAMLREIKAAMTKPHWFKEHEPEEGRARVPRDLVGTMQKRRDAARRRTLQIHWRGQHRQGRRQR